MFAVSAAIMIVLCEVIPIATRMRGVLALVLGIVVVDASKESPACPMICTIGTAYTVRSINGLLLRHLVDQVGVSKYRSRNYHEAQ